MPHLRLFNESNFSDEYNAQQYRTPITSEQLTYIHSLFDMKGKELTEECRRLKVQHSHHSVNLTNKSSRICNLIAFTLHGKKTLGQLSMGYRYVIMEFINQIQSERDGYLQQYIFENDD